MVITRGMGPEQILSEFGKVDGAAPLTCAEPCINAQERHLNELKNSLWMVGGTARTYCKERDVLEAPVDCQCIPRY